MHVFEIEDIQRGYVGLIEHVLRYGTAVAPRGQSTREIQALTIIHHNPRHCLITGIGRKANLAIGAAEAAQLLAGMSYPDLMTRISPRFSDFMDDGLLYGAYGPRTALQFDNVVRVLSDDPDSRRAHVSIWEREDIFVEGKHDYPCTIGFTFQIRGDSLDMHAHMRSNDVWWGFTYDVFQFCTLQITMAEVLGVGVGKYFHHVESFHIYDRDVKTADDLHTPEADSARYMQPVVDGTEWYGVENEALKALAQNGEPFSAGGEILHGLIWSKL